MGAQIVCDATELIAEMLFCNCATLNDALHGFLCMGAETRSQLTDPICICPSKLDIRQRALENAASIAQKHWNHMDCEAFALQYLGQSLMLLLLLQ